MTDTKPKEQIEILQGIMGRTTGIEALVNPDMITDILASLKELAAIKSQPVPVEPYIVKQDRVDNVVRTFTDTRLKYIDSLKQQLQVAQQELEVQMVGWSDCEEKLTKAEADHKAAEQNVSDLMAEIAQTGALLMKAEASNKRLVELLNDASGALKVYSNRHTDCSNPLADYCLTCDTQKRIDAELLREVGK